MITAVDQEEEIVRAIQAQVSGYIVKPFEPATLQAKIEQIVGGAARV